MDLGVRGEGYLIVGGTAGMGFEAARALAADGARVAIAGQRPRAGGTRCGRDPCGTRDRRRAVGR